jgi:hypothetical protein
VEDVLPERDAQLEVKHKNSERVSDQHKQLVVEGGF